MQQVKIVLENIAPSSVENVLQKATFCPYAFVEDGIHELPHLRIHAGGINLLPDWNIVTMPFIYPQNIELTAENLTACSYVLTDQVEKINSTAWANNFLWNTNLDNTKKILHKALLDSEVYAHYTAQSQFEEYLIAHNSALILHYNSKKTHIPQEQIDEQFKHAAYLAPDSFWMAFTHYLHSIYLLEIESYQEALELVYRNSRRSIPETAKALCYLTSYNTLCAYENKKKYADEILTIERYFEDTPNIPQDIAHEYHRVKSMPLDPQEQNEAQEKTLLQSIQYYNTTDSREKLASRYQDLGDVYLKMAQFGDKSKYVDAQKAYHETLKTFKKTNFPIPYGLCQMNLGIIYAELPTDDLKKNIYAGLAQTAFSEAMNIFSKSENPLQYATICTNFSNAMMRLLPRIDKERFEKISFYLFEALDIRKASHFPEERAISILSLINLYFHRIESTEEKEELWVEEIKRWGEEMLGLTKNEYLCEMASKAIAFTQKVIT